MTGAWFSDGEGGRALRLSRVELAAGLTKGARGSQGALRQAAVHLLCACGVVDDPAFARHVELVAATGCDGEGTWARVRDWEALREDPALALTDKQPDVVALACSLADGAAVDLSRVSRLGSGYAARVAQAIIIALGGEGWYVVADGPEAIRRREAWALGEIDD